MDIDNKPPAVGPEAIVRPWEKREITWRYLHSGEKHRQTFDAALAAFALWKAAGVFTFRLVPPEQDADITIKWDTFLAENPNRNAKKGLVPDPDIIARAQLPRRNAPRKIWLNNAPGVSFKSRSDGWWKRLFGGAWLETTLLHEVGHALGLRHSGDIRDVMYATAPMSDSDPTPADLQRLRALYA